MAKLAMDQFGQHGQDVRDSIRQARLHAMLAGMVGSKKTIHPHKMMYQFEAPKEQRMDELKRRAEAVARAFGGTVIKDGRKVT